MSEGLPALAPFESCVGCFKGDTETVVVIEGSAEWLIAGLEHATGIPRVQATQMVLDHAVEAHGCDPGKVPPGRMQILPRLCRECAARSDTTVFTVDEVRAGTARGWVQPQD